MPIYEYYCRSCDHEWEREQRISDAPVRTCPSCKARQAKRMISRTSFVLKGGGWYSDLYSSTGKKDDAKSESSSESSSSEKSSDKSSTDSGSKDSGSKDSGSTDSGSTDSGSKDSGSKSGSKSKKKGSKAA